MNTNHQNKPYKSFRKDLRVGKYSMLAVGSAALLATVGAAFALWPNEQKDPLKRSDRLANEETSLIGNRPKDQSNNKRGWARLADRNTESAPRKTQKAKEVLHGGMTGDAEAGSHLNQASAWTWAQSNLPADRHTAPSPVRRLTSTQSNTSRAENGNPPYYLPNNSGIPKIYAVTDEVSSVDVSAFPKKGIALSPAQFSELMTGRINFSPQSIPQSGQQVTEHTPLQIGQEVLLKWESNWWAATVTGFEPDGAIRVTYFGWSRSWDEAVPRSDLQLDTNTREKAIQTVYSYNP